MVRDLTVRRPLARRLILSMIGVSSLIAVLISAVQLYIEYRRDVGAIHDHFSIIEQSYLPSIEETTWLIDMVRLNTLLSGIARLPDFRFAEVRSEGRALAQRGSRDESNLMERSFPLRYEYRGRRVEIGVLAVGASISSVQRRAWERAGFILAANSLKTFLVAFFMVWLVQRLIVGPLSAMAGHAVLFRDRNAWERIRFSDAAGGRGDEIALLGAVLDRVASHLGETFLNLNRVNAELAERVREKEVLLKEIYHRVKNNLQVVASLLHMQERTVKEQATRRLLQDSANRVRSIALVHEQLYRSSNLSNIRFRQYALQLAGHLMQANRPLSQRVPLRLEVADFELGVETAIPCGLIINELITNAFKHAYAEGASGEIVLEVQVLDDGRVKMRVADNGRGLPEGFDPASGESLGMQLVMALATQLNARFCYGTRDGAWFEVVFFPDTRESERLAVGE